MANILYTRYLVLFVCGVAGSALLVPLVKRMARYIGACDPPSMRRVHDGHTPTLGGLAVAIPFFIALAVLYVWPSPLSRAFFGRPTFVLAFYTGSFIILLLGVYDDIFGAVAWLKLAVQLAAAGITVALAGPINTVEIPLLGNLPLYSVAVPFTLLWIVGITNGFNLIDGIDGLASGVGFLVCVTCFLVAALHGRADMMVFSALMGGLLLGFLPYNFHPASIFLGDTGSLFIGFTVSVIAMKSSMKTSVATATMVPFVALGYPVLDLFLAVVRRLMKGKPVFSTDRSHIHHKLLASGFDHRAVSGVAYGLTVLFTLCGILAVYGRVPLGGLVFALILGVLVLMFQTFGYWRYVRDRFDLSLRRKFRIYHLVRRFAALKIREASSIDAVWRALRLVAAEYDLAYLRLTWGGEDLSWQNPQAQDASVASTKVFPLNIDDGKLEIAHAGKKRDDIKREQNLLLEQLGSDIADKLSGLPEQE